MTYEDAVARICHHASIGATVDAEPTTSLTFAIWLYEKRGKPAEFKALFRDVLDCLEITNREINGDKPSGTHGRQLAIDFKLVNATNKILDAGWQLIVPRASASIRSNELANQLTPLFWAISCAWTAILAGDIDSLADNLENIVTATQVLIDPSLLEGN